LLQEQFFFINNTNLDSNFCASAMYVFMCNQSLVIPYLIGNEIGISCSLNADIKFCPVRYLVVNYACQVHSASTI